MIWYNNKRRVALLLLIFFPLGFYGLWMSDRFPKSLKNFITVVVAVASVLWYSHYEKSDVVDPASSNENAAVVFTLK